MKGIYAIDLAGRWVTRKTGALYGGSTGDGFPFFAMPWAWETGVQGVHLRARSARTRGGERTAANEAFRLGRDEMLYRGLIR